MVCPGASLSIIWDQVTREGLRSPVPAAFVQSPALATWAGLRRKQWRPPPRDLACPTGGEGAGAREGPGSQGKGQDPVQEVPCFPRALQNP